jgi:hypothetical protein
MELDFRDKKAVFTSRYFRKMRKSLLVFALVTLGWLLACNLVSYVLDNQQGTVYQVNNQTISVNSGKVKVDGIVANKVEDTNRLGTVLWTLLVVSEPLVFMGWMVVQAYKENEFADAEIKKEN